MLGPRSFDKVRDALHFFVVLRNQTFEPFAIVKETRFSFLSYEIHELGNDRLNRRKQLRVIARATRVPVAKRFPVVSVSSRTKNIALSREDEVRADRECEIREAGFEQINRTARVDRPDRAGFLQFANADRDSVRDRSTSPLPFVKGERMKVRGLRRRRIGSERTLTHPSPLGRERRQRL